MYLRGRKLRILIVIDNFTRLVVGTLVDFSIPASRVLPVIEKLIALYSRPRIFRTDNGSEFIEGRLNRFLSNARIRHEFIEKDKPQQNGFSESFNARFGDGCLRMLDLNLLYLSHFWEYITCSGLYYSNRSELTSISSIPVSDSLLFFLSISCYIHALREIRSLIWM